MKRCELVLEVAAASRSRLCCRIVGTGPDEQRLVRLAGELGLGAAGTIASIQGKAA